MRDIDQALPLDPSDLQNEEMAFRFYYASDGYLGWIMEVIREAAIRAIDTDSHCLNMPLLAAAYEARLAGTEEGDGKVNPFATAKFTKATADQLEFAAKKRRTHTKPRTANQDGKSMKNPQKRAS